MSKLSSILNTLKFTFFTVLTLALVFCSVLFTILNMYKQVFKAYINGEFIGYFASERQFEEVYNDLVTEKINEDANVKVYLASEPTFEVSYTRESLIEAQDIYTNLRANLKTEYIVYKVLVNNEEKMTFSTQDEANKYSEYIKKEVSKLEIEVVEQKSSEVSEITTIEKADEISKDIIDKNKPVVVKPTTTITNNGYTSTTQTASSQIANSAMMQGGIWPTTSRYVSSYYGWRWGTIHTGTDIAGKYADPIYAYKDGLVVYSGWAGSYGYIVKLDHGNGFATWYAHCSKLLVKAGDEVKQGQTISLMGSTGFSTGNHVHFEVRINGVHVNSYPYIAGK